MATDAAFGEAWFRTAKYAPGFPVDGFASLEAARLRVLRFVRRYNDEHRHSGVRHVTPGHGHRGEDIEILAHRDRVYAAAKARRPERRSGSTRDRSPVGDVWLDPERAPEAELLPA